MNLSSATQDPHENLSRGDRVSILLSGGEIVSRIVWDVHKDCVSVCSERQFSSLAAGKMDFGIPIGFKWKDVVGGNNE